MGVMPTSQALSLARERGVDLVEISAKTEPPICKLIEYGKMLYALQKKEKQARTAGKVKEIKGIRITFRMDEGDLNRQKSKTEEFLQQGHSVRIQLVMKGREKAHQDLALEKINAFVQSLAEVSKLESEPRGAGYQIVAVLKPSKR